MRPADRRGFALFTVLIVIAAASTLGFGIEASAGAEVDAAVNRWAIARAQWRAEGCLDDARGALSEALSHAVNQNVWDAADSVVRHTAPSDCSVEIRPEAVGVNVNTATPQQLAAVFHAGGLNSALADSLADAIVDWRDEDDVARPSGAERAWYLARGLAAPRNGPLTDNRELDEVAGLATARARFPWLEQALSVAPGPRYCARTPIAALAALPGFGDEALRRLRADSIAGSRTCDIGVLAGELSPVARDTLLTHAGDLATTLIPHADHWVITATAAEGSPAVRVSVELTVAAVGWRIAVVRRRSWL